MPGRTGLLDGLEFRAGRVPPGLALLAFAGLTLVGLALLLLADGTTLIALVGLSSVLTVSC